MMHIMQSHTEREDRTKRMATRITVTLPPEDYEEVVRLSKEKRVSASWIVRDAVANYVVRDPSSGHPSQRDATNTHRFLQ
jgi:metal-responsive CopG/Arc/MetJ family transcriptional regulator